MDSIRPDILRPDGTYRAYHAAGQARGPGLEPGLRDPKSPVLPLDDPRTRITGGLDALAPPFSSAKARRYLTFPWSPVSNPARPNLAAILSWFAILSSLRFNLPATGYGGRPRQTRSGPFPSILSRAAPKRDICRVFDAHRLYHAVSLGSYFFLLWRMALRRLRYLCRAIFLRRFLTTLVILFPSFHHHRLSLAR